VVESGPVEGAVVEEVDGVEGDEEDGVVFAVGNCTLSEPPAGTASPGLRRVGAVVCVFSVSPSAEV
jgi:hypothetical protein